MNIYDKAHELAVVLKNCPEVLSLRECSEKIKENDLNKKMLEDFRKVQIEAYSQQMKGGKISKDLEEKIQKLGSVICLKPDLAAYLQAEQKFGVLWEDIMKILNDAIDVNMAFEKSK